MELLIIMICFAREQLLKLIHTVHTQAHCRHKTQKKHTSEIGENHFPLLAPPVSII